MSDNGEYTFEKAVENLQAIANSMADVAADLNHDSRTRLVASALDVTIENLLFILKGASISWTPTLSDEDNDRIQRVKAYGTGQGPRPFTDADTWQPTDALLVDEALGQRVADSFVYSNRPPDWTPKDWTILNRFESFMSRPWRRAT